MKRLLGLGVLLVAAAGCDPSLPKTGGVGSGGGAEQIITAIFDPGRTPPAVPTPTDLARSPATGLLNLPIAPDASPAQRELLSYLNTLRGYPADTPAKASFDGPLDRPTVTSSNVKVLSLSGAPAPVAGVTLVYAPSGSGSQIAILPPPGGWGIGKTYGIAIVGGSSGVKGAAGQYVAGSSTFLFVRGANPLVSGCTQPLTATLQCNPDCRTVSEAIPTSQTDPAARLVDQSCTASRLEALRLSYAPFISALTSQNIPREDIVLVWTFTIANNPLVTFDPANAIIPFPNNAVLGRPPTDGGRPLVNLPIPSGGSPLIAQLYQGLNTLDGFSTTAPIVSQNSTTMGSLSEGDVDPATVTLLTQGFTRLPGGAPGHAPTTPQVTAAVTTVPVLADGGMPTTQLVWVPQVPLDERTTYGAYVTTGIKDTAGRNAIAATPFALARLANPLFDGIRSTVDLISDDQARQLEPLRAGLKPFIDSLATPLGGRNNIALAWAFTTQSEISALDQLSRAPSGLPPATANPGFLLDVTSLIRPSCPGLCPSVNNFLLGELTVPVLLTGPGGVFNPSAPPSLRNVPFLLVLPTGTPPPNGFPINIFGHDFTRARTDLINIANSLAAAGHASVAIDTVWHGERSSCIGSAQALGQSSDDAACASPSTQMCAAVAGDLSRGRCIARNRSGLAACNFGTPAQPNPTADLPCIAASQGFCFSDNLCEGGDFSRDSTSVPRISGWNILNLANLFATRDNFRQQVIDLFQVVRVLSVDPATAGSLRALLAGGGFAPVDPSSIHYLGQGLGGILGTLFTAASPDVHNSVLNVPGADPVNILLLSPDFTLSAARNALLAMLAGQGIVPETLAYNQFIGIARWILDPADPQNMAFSLTNAPGAPLDRRALIQYITDDQVVPNATTAELIAAARRTGTPAPDECPYSPTTTDLPLPGRHGFLLNFANPAVTLTAQGSAAGYLRGGPLSCP